MAAVEIPRFRRLPRHVGLIPDGNRRWARARGLLASEGYQEGVSKGLEMLVQCRDMGIEEVSLYGFTQDNTKRARPERIAFSAACVEFAHRAVSQGIALLVLGDTSSPMFPSELKPLAEARQGTGMKVNMLVNYGWNWDLAQGAVGGGWSASCIALQAVSRIDLVVRWGGCRRLSGFLPVQSVYADFFVVPEMWPDYDVSQFLAALEWFQHQEPTLGG